MTKKEEDFKTHIKEPRWQQIVSLIIALGLFGTWLWFFLQPFLR
jgi:hypothetical protein